MSENVHIPKFIQQVPWYNRVEGDALAHHRKDPSVQDSGAPQAGAGIQDQYSVTGGRQAADYEANRDRWHGHDAEEWNEILARWNAIKGKTTTANQSDSDDTDYELELEELGLRRSDIKSGHIEDPMEKSIRDRRDVPAYILAINGNAGGKIRLGQDLTAGIVHSAGDFVRTSASLDPQKQQQFAWVKEAGAMDTTEASPTLMMMKSRERDAERRKKGEEKRRKLMERY